MPQKTYILAETPIDVYFQKSLRFLFPVLQIPIDKYTPQNTYLKWQDELEYQCYQLICVYDLKDEPEFRRFEKNILQTSKHLINYQEAAGNKGVYIFTLQAFAPDVDHFYKGHYSEISAGIKKVILAHYYANKASREYMDSFLNPEKYFEQYAALLNVEESLLRSIGELCDRYDLIKETLCLKRVEVVQEIENLQMP